MHSKLTSVRHVLFVFFAGFIILAVGIQLPESSAKPYIIATLLVAAFLIYRYVIDRRSLTPQQQEAEKRIQKMLNAGEALAHERMEPLTAEDLEKLKPQRYVLLLTIVACVVIFSAVGIFLISLLEHWSVIYLQFFTAISCIVGFGYWGRQWLRKFDAIIQAGLKTVIRGIITKKFVEREENRSDYYFLTVGETRVKVKKDIYKKYEVGDGVEMHVLKPWHNMFLSEKKLM